MMHGTLSSCYRHNVSQLETVQWNLLPAYWLWLGNYSALCSTLCCNSLRAICRSHGLKNKYRQCGSHESAPESSCPAFANLSAGCRRSCNVLKPFMLTQSDTDALLILVQIHAREREAELDKVISPCSCSSLPPTHVVFMSNAEAV